MGNHPVSGMVWALKEKMALISDPSLAEVTLQATNSRALLSYSSVRERRRRKALADYGLCGRTEYS